MGDTDEDLLPESELEDQLLVALALARKLESEINNMVDGMENKAAGAEAKRLMADRTAAALQAEADAIELSGRKHTHHVVHWWLLGSLLAWLIGLVISLVVSPVLGFIIYIPIVAISLLLGYMSSNVEYKIDLADLKRARARSQAGHPVADRDTEEFIGQLLGVDPSSGGDGGGHGRYDGTADGTGSLLLSVVTTSAGLVYNAAVLSFRATRWLMGGSPAKVKAS